MDDPEIDLVASGATRLEQGQGVAPLADPAERDAEGGMDATLRATGLLAELVHLAAMLQRAGAVPPP